MNPTLAVAVVAQSLAILPDAGPFEGQWRAWLDSPGGELPFGLDIQPSGNDLRAFVINGPERIEIPTVEVAGREIVLGFDHYDSRIRARPTEEGAGLEGEWTKTAARGAVTRLVFHAEPATGRRFSVDPLAPEASSARSGTLPERWSAQFESSSDAAVLMLEHALDGSLAGTFLTTTGDYRFLAGEHREPELYLSAFDGAHAFLFKARVVEGQDDGLRLQGDFWSRDTWHETWTATPDPDAQLPDAFTETTWTGAEGDANDLEGLVFRTLDGSKRSVASFKREGRPLLVTIFGTWCPNCSDATRYLRELHGRYHERGLDVLGLAFELSGDATRDTQQVKRYVEVKEIPWPVLLAGISDKSEASKAMPVLDRVRSYPTTIFIDKAGRVRWIHTGFSGPATGSAYDELRASFERRIEEMLDEH